MQIDPSHSLTSSLLQGRVAYWRVRELIVGEGVNAGSDLPEDGEVVLVGLGGAVRPDDGLG